MELPPSASFRQTASQPLPRGETPPLLHQPARALPGETLSPLSVESGTGTTSPPSGPPQTFLGGSHHNATGRMDTSQTHFRAMEDKILAPAGRLPPLQHSQPSKPSRSPPRASAPGPPNPGEDDLRVADVMQANDAFGDNEITTSKYTLVSFLPRNLFEQFRRTANIYFLLISLLMVVGTYFKEVFDSPLTPFTTLGPLIGVLLISMIKEGIEDSKRHKSDTEVNNRPARVLQPDGTEADVKWIDIRVGQVIRVDNRGEVPADMVLLQTSEPAAACYVETSNIDGETNLKIKEGVADVAAKFASPQDIGTVAGKASYELPNDSIHTFEGRLELHGFQSPIPVHPKNVVLRGCTIRNTKWVLGMVVFTGLDTKVMKKAAGARSKMSRVEATVNRCIAVIFVTQLLLCAVSTILERVWNNENDNTVPYLQLDSQDLVIPEWLSVFLTFIVLYNNFIPISLYVSIEMVNFAQALLVDTDGTMYDPVSDTPAKARTSNLNQDLGQVQYVFSDKTGTLTRNVMEFKMCSIGGKSFGRLDTPEDIKAAKKRESRRLRSKQQAAESKSEPVAEVDMAESFHAPRLREVLKGTASPTSIGVRQADLDNFFTCMALCHTIVPEEGPGGAVVYQAESPDEGALVGAARALGYEFVSRTTDTMTIKTRGNTHTYDLLGVHAFDATRKRMSVVVRDPTGEHFLFTKGADNIILERAAHGEHDATMHNHLGNYASDGLRTLVLAMRHLPAAEAAEWKTRFDQANGAVGNRKQLLSHVAETVERGLTVVGATAIEDKLQEGVPETIHDLARAGIKTWVLTGDKVETAINIGHSCRLLTDDMELIHLTQDEPDALVRYLTALASSAPDDGEEEEGGLFASLFCRCLRPAPVSPRHTRPSASRPPSQASVNSERQVEVSAARATETNPIAGNQRRYNSMDNPPAPERPAERSPGFPKLSLDSTGPAPAMVVTGQALKTILGDSSLEAAFLRVAKLCKSVVACRVSPPQKAALVRMVRKQVAGKPVTLAIGDGANDVGMIQQAEVGVGISGKEGLQAVNASDFAIAQFRFLKTLLLVHGRWSYRRMAKVFLYSFYKNVAITLVLFYYNIYTGWSGTSLFEPLVYSGFNFFLGLPIIGVGIMDRDLSKETMLAHPATYVSGLRNLNLNIHKMILWIVAGVVHATVVFFVPLGAMLAQGGVGWASDGEYEGKEVAGLIIYTALILGMQFKVAFITVTWTKWTHVLLWVSVLGYFIFILGYNFIVDFAPGFYFVAAEMLALPAFWFIMVLTLGVFVLLDYSVEHLRLSYTYTPVDIAMEIDRGLGVHSKTTPDWGDGFPATTPSAAAGSGGDGYHPPAGVAAPPLGSGFLHSNAMLDGGGTGESRIRVPAGK